MTDQTQTKSAGFDLSRLDDTTRVTFKVDLVFDGAGEPLSGFEVIGSNEPEIRSILDELRKQGTIRANAKKGKLDLATDDGAEKMIEIVDQNEFNKALTAIVGWYGFKSGDVDAPFDRATLKRLLTKFPTWVDKVNEAVANDANFIKG